MRKERIKLGLLRIALENPSVFEAEVEQLDVREKERIKSIGETFQKQLQASKDGKRTGRMHRELQMVYNFVANGLDPNLE